MAESLFLNKRKVDLYNKPITRKIQIGEVSQVAERKSSYSYTIKIPKTANNTAIFDMLGTSGNTSRKPFENIIADYVIDSVYLVLNGSAIIRQTGKDYQVNIIDGVRGLADLLGDSKLIDLPLDDLNHIISTQEYVDSYNNTEGFIYGIANYGRGISSSLKVEKQAPSIYTHTLFRRIFESNGLSLQGEFFTTNEKYLNEVVTPSRGYLVEFAQLQSDPKGGADSNTLSDYQFSNDYIQFEEKFTMSDNGLVGAIITGGDIEFTVPGTYKIDLTITANLYQTYANIIFRINGSSKSYIYLEEGSNVKTKSITFTVEAGDVVSLWISGSSGFEYEEEFQEGFAINYTASVDGSLYLQTGGQVIQASDYIGDMSQIDFLKDVVNRYGLVLHPVQNTNEFRFKRLEAVLSDRATAEDWTAKLSSINSENYNSGYAKVNKANFQYPDSIVVPTHDGEMLVDNENANSEKTMFSSPFEIPAQSSGSVSGEKVYMLPVWGEESQGTVEVETELNFDEENENNYLLTDGELIKITPSSIISDKYISNTGSLVSNVDYNIQVYPISLAQKRNVVSYLTGNDIAVFAFYEDAALATLVSVGTVNSSGSNLYDEVLTAPANANYVAISAGFENITSDNQFNSADYISGSYIFDSSGQPSGSYPTAARTNLIRVYEGQHLFFAGYGDYFKIHTYSGNDFSNWIENKGTLTDYVVEAGVTHIAMTLTLSDGNDYSGTFQINLDSLKAYDSYASQYVQDRSVLYLDDEAGNNSEGWIVRKYENIDTTDKTYKATGRIEFSGMAFVCFYDVNDNFISYQYSGSGSAIDYEKASLFIPSNCKIIRVTGHNDYLPTLYQYEQVEFITALNEETPLKVMHINRLDKTITAKFYNEVTGITVSENIPFLNLDFISLQYVLANYYKAFQALIENYKKVTLGLNLSVVDIFNIDFFKLKFMKQTGRYYYLNAIQHTAGKISKVEAIEIQEFPQNQPPSQIGNYSFEMNHEATRTITQANLTTGYEDPELDEPLKVKIISGFNTNILLKQNGVEITSETEILFEDLALQAVEVLGGLDAYSESWVFAIADKGSGSYGTLTGVLTANVRELINQPPVANAGSDVTEQLLPPEFPYETFVQLNGSASYDYTGDIVSYIWTIESQPPLSDVTITSGGSSPYGSLEVPNDLNNVGNYTIKLTVTDEFGATDDDTMIVTIEPSEFEPPV